jgi:hypothetical protein
LSGGSIKFKGGEKHRFRELVFHKEISFGKRLNIEQKPSLQAKYTTQILG